MALPMWLGGDGEAFGGYLFIKGGFRLATHIFYGNIIRDQHALHVPPVGEAALICFNHMNGLTDPMLMIRACPRMIRFIAKDTLWKQFFIGSLVSSAGAVPVKRAADHGDGKMDNTEALQGILKAWEDGHIVAVAPEGDSKMRTMLKPGINPGSLNWVVKAVVKHWNDSSFKIRVLPCGVVYLHPYSWRSEVSVRYGKPIIVDAALIKSIIGDGGSLEEITRDDIFKCVAQLAELVEGSMRSVILDIPPPANATVYHSLEGDWAAFRNGIIAARIYTRPWSGDRLDVSLRAWIEICQEFATQLQKEEHKELTLCMNSYYRRLAKAGIRDEQVRQAIVENCKPSLCVLSFNVAIGLAKCFLLFVLALPGALFWSPIFLICLVMENSVRRKGRQIENGEIIRLGANFDTIASTKMCIGFVLLTLECIIFGIGSLVYAGNLGFSIGARFAIGLFVGTIALPMLLWIAMRALESAFAIARWVRSQWAMQRISARTTLPTLSGLRKAIEYDILKLDLQPIVEVRRHVSGVDSLPPRSWLRRSKSDWHESFSEEDLSWYGMAPQQ